MFLRPAVKLSGIGGYYLMNSLRLDHVHIPVAAILASGMLIVSAQAPRDADFADLIRTPADIQRTLEHCDGHPEFEMALANWLEMAEPSSPERREAIYKTSLRLLEDTTDLQLVLSLSDGLLRHALEDIKRDQAISPEELARTLYADIGRAVRKERFKVKAVSIPAYGLAEDGTVTDERQASFLERFLNLAEPRTAHFVAPSQRRPGDPTRASREQAERKNPAPPLPASMHVRR
jgi:hypothetical protein